MEINVEDLPVDPTAAYVGTIEMFRGLPLNIRDLNGPLTMLMEACAVNTAKSIEASSLYQRRAFPINASDFTELAYHLSNYDEPNLFSTPSTCKFKFVIPMAQIIDMGIPSVYGDEWIIVIPKYSTITVDETSFTLMNDIRVVVIKKIEGYTSFVENVINEESLVLKNLGNIYSKIIYSNDIPYVAFETTLIQASVTSYIAIAIPGTPHIIKIENEEDYYMSIVETKINGEWTVLDKMYTDKLLPTNTTTVVTNVETDGVKFYIPDSYITKGMTGPEVRYTALFTAGKIIKQMSKYSDNRYNLRVRQYDLTPEEEASNQLDIVLSSNDVINSGVNRTPFKDMKTKVVNRSTGFLDLPITELQLLEKGKHLGLKLKKINDALLRRVYMASKPIEIDNDIDIAPYVFYGMSNILFNSPGDIPDSISITDSYLVIKAGSLFTGTQDSVRPLIRSEVNEINSLPVIKGVKIISDKSVTITPYHTVIDNSLDRIYARTYDTDTPELGMLEIYNKNTDEIINANINGYNIFKDEDTLSYHIFFRILGNEDYEAVKSNIRILMHISTLYEDYVSFESELNLEITQAYFPDASEPLHHIRIDIDEYFDKDDMAKIINGDVHGTSRLFSLSKRVELFIVSNETNRYDNASIESKTYSGDIPYVVFTKQRIDLKLVSRLKYIWNFVRETPTIYKFKTYTEDVPLIHAEDVYRVFNNGCRYLFEDTDGDGTCDKITYDVLYEKGDIATDVDGYDIIKHHMGDIVYEDGEPVLDTVRGIQRDTSIVLMEYAYKFIKNTSYNTAFEDVREVLTHTIIDDMEYINSIALDNTQILFRNSIQFTEVRLKDKTYVPSHVSPTVTIYIDQDKEIELPDMVSIKTLFAKIINKYLLKQVIEIDKIEQELASKFRDASLITISELTPDNRRIISIDGPVNRLSVKKKVDGLTIVPDLTLVVTRL